MTQSVMINAKEIADTLGCSENFAYKIIKGLNKELREMGYLTIRGKTSRQFFMEKIYGNKKIGTVAECQ